ncbi:MAG: AI-2E family transporter [Phycisphaerales bacterium]
MPVDPGSSSQLPPEPGRRDLDRLHLWQFQAIRDVLVILGLVFIVMVGYWLRAVTVPLLIALALAYLVEPIVDRVSSHPRISRPLVVGGMVGVLGVLFLVAVVTIVPLAVFQTIDLVKALPGTVRTLVEEVDQRLPEEYEGRLIRLLPAERTVVPVDGESDGELVVVEPGTPLEGAGDEVSEGATGESADGVADPPPPSPVELWIRSNLGSIFQTTWRTTTDALELILGILGATIYIAFLLFLIPFYFFAFSTSWPGIRRFFRQLVPAAHSDRIYRIVGKMDDAVSGFVRGRIVISLIMGVLLAIGWAIVGVPYWMLLGLITGLFCAVPYLGGIGVPVAIILLWIGESDKPESLEMAWWGILLWPTLVFVIVQLIEGYILTPVIAGKSTNLGPVSILVAVLAGGAVGGVYGMLLAIPAAACLKILFTDVWLPRIQAWTEGRATDILPINEQ